MPVVKSSSEKLTLFFIRDVLRTEKELALADSLEGKVVFRNFNFASVVEADVAFVAGMTRNDIPEVYKGFPLAQGLEDKWAAAEKAIKRETTTKAATTQEIAVVSAVVPPTGAAVAKG